ncbi:MAG: nucleotide sugar dehydrogenase [Acidimicrobiia bacterium]|nr:nucleotide sugar dehydrogenase [Acidimicrobiia bacterium]
MSREPNTGAATPAESDRARYDSLYARFGKPVLDRVVVLVLGVFSLPVLLIIVAVVRVVLRVPPIERSPSVGRNGRVFDLFRLRTVLDGSVDPHSYRRRVAEFIRQTSLDELPQLWNVLLGHMSMVGPRPISPEEARGLADWELERHRVKPGITGLWQVEARGDGRDLMENIHFDIQYVDQLSFGTDLQILGRTVAMLAVRREGEPAPDGGTRLRERVRHLRLITADVALWLGALAAATYIRFDFSWAPVDEARLAVVFMVAAGSQLAIGFPIGLYRGKWRLGSFDEVVWVASVTAAVTALVLALSTFVTTPFVPRGAVVGAGALHLLGAFGARYVTRISYEKQQRSIHRRPHRILVFGAGEAGISSVRAIWNDPTSEFEPVAFLDDDTTKRGVRYHGMPVIGTSADLRAVARRYGADSLLVAIPSAPVGVANRIADVGRDLGLRVQVLPPLVESLGQLLVEHAQQRPDIAPSYRPSGPARTPGPERTADPRDFDLAIIGLGYVGLPVAVEASRVGVRVLGLDINEDRVAHLNAGNSYIEDVSSDDLRAAIGGGFVATTDSSMLARADAITISVPTPLRGELPDLSAVIGASEAIGDYLQPGQLVILESTTYPGTTDEIVLPILEERSGLRAGEDFYLAYSPERIDPGNTTYGIHNTPKLVGGIDAASTERAAMLYQKFSEVVAMSGTREAEMAKLLENTYRHVNIALVNELAIFCQQLGVDIWETIRGAATKPFGFQAFYPGPGVGGHCIPIDPNYLSFRVRELGEQFRFIELAQEINEYMPRYVARRAIRMLTGAGSETHGATVLLVGVAYKPNVGDTRETPATAVARELMAAGITVEFVDPHVDSFIVDGIVLRRHVEATSAAAGSDLSIIHTPHDDIDIDGVCVAAALVLDTRGVTKLDQAERL